MWQSAAIKIRAPNITQSLDKLLQPIMRLSLIAALFFSSCHVIAGLHFAVTGNAISVCPCTRAYIPPSTNHQAATANRPKTSGYTTRRTVPKAVPHIPRNQTLAKKGPALSLDRGYHRGIRRVPPQSMPQGGQHAGRVLGHCDEVQGRGCPDPARHVPRRTERRGAQAVVRGDGESRRPLGQVVGHEEEGQCVLLYRHRELWRPLCLHRCQYYGVSK